MQRKLSVIAVGLVPLAFALISCHDAQAVPAFARKFVVSCVACHTTPPRLNETGYRFRAAGFRWPEAIGSKEREERFDLLDYMSARIRKSASRVISSNAIPVSLTVARMVPVA